MDYKKQTYNEVGVMKYFTPKYIYIGILGIIISIFGIWFAYNTKQQELCNLISKDNSDIYFYFFAAMYFFSFFLLIVTSLNNLFVFFHLNYFKNKRHYALFVISFFTICCAFFIPSVLFTLSYSNQIKFDALKAYGKIEKIGIVSSKYSKSSKGSSYYLYYFNLSNDPKHLNNHCLTRSENSLHVGDSIEIIYLPYRSNVFAELEEFKKDEIRFSN